MVVIYDIVPKDNHLYPPLTFSLLQHSIKLLYTSTTSTLFKSIINTISMHLGMNNALIFTTSGAIAVAHILIRIGSIEQEDMIYW